MRVRFAVVPLVLFSALAGMAETIIPAGSLIQCTVSEHRFSSKTAEVGDPVLCQAGLIEGAWGSALPYGSVLVGRFAEYKDPGHFIGKGWMELKFDRVLLPPDRVVPLAAKVVYVPGMPVDKYGRIKGKGHATRDIVEWSIPVLWPIDLLALPVRGPRPVLKEETRLTLKVMDDMAVPGNDPAPRSLTPMASARPDAYGFATRQPAITSYGYRRVIPATPVSTLQATPMQTAANQQLTVLMLTDGNGRLATDYWFEGGKQVRYTAPNGASVVIPIENLDLAATTEMNQRRGVPFFIRPAVN